jgi:subtilisin family serine protease
VAATAIGRSVGVAKAARLVAVRVLDCQGSGSISDTVAGCVHVGCNAGSTRMKGNHRMSLVLAKLNV